MNLKCRSDMKTKNYPRALMPQIKKSNLKEAPHPYKKMNMLVRRIKPSQSERIPELHNKARSMYRKLIVRPIIVDRDNYIVNGHHRYDVAQELGMKKVKVIKVFVTLEELMEYYEKTI
jgi:hypothetical protein